jgi:hypothetical protein
MHEDEYHSSWEWTRQHSQWHFDYTRHDQTGEWWQPLGRFQGDWSQDLSLTEDTKAITWATRKDSPYYQRPDGTFEQSRMLAQEENDLRDIGAPVDLSLTDVAEQASLGPVLTKMYRYFELEDPWVRLHLQQPGQMFNLHIDKLYDRCPEDPDRIVRIMVMLSDWEPGHFYCFGTQNISHWRAGDIHTFSWRDVPHATANAGRTVRPLLIMTGLATERTREILAQASADSVYAV